MLILVSPVVINLITSLGGEVVQELVEATEPNMLLKWEQEFTVLNLSKGASNTWVDIEERSCLFKEQIEAFRTPIKGSLQKLEAENALVVHNMK